MRNIVNDTGKKNDEKQIGKMEKYFSKLHFLHRTFLKKMAFISPLHRAKVKVIWLSTYIVSK